MAKYLIKIVVQGATVVGRAFTKALRQEIQAFQDAPKNRNTAKEGPRSAATSAMTGISVEEAKQILNVRDLDPKKIQENYKFLFEINEKSKGGSFYLQSKVYRAKERLDAELEALNKASKPSSQSKDSGT